MIVNYVSSTSSLFHLNADQIIYLRALGIPQDITKAMLVHDGQWQQQNPGNQPYYPQPQPMPGQMPPPYGVAPPYGDMSQQPPVQIVTPTTPAPEVTVADPGYVDYGYSYPYYGWPYYGYGYGGWPIVVGWRLGLGAGDLVGGTVGFAAASVAGEASVVGFVVV